MPLIREKIIEYKKRFLEKPGYVVEIGNPNLDGFTRKLFEDAEDFCQIDEILTRDVDIIGDCHKAESLFDYNPDVVLCLRMLEYDKRPKAIIKSVRELLMPGGYMIISTPYSEEGSYADVMFGGYEILDLSIVEYNGHTTICGIAKKPYTINHDIKNY